MLSCACSFLSQYFKKFQKDLNMRVGSLVNDDNMLYVINLIKMTPQLQILQHLKWSQNHFHSFGFLCVESVNLFSYPINSILIKTKKKIFPCLYIINLTIHGILHYLGSADLNWFCKYLPSLDIFFNSFCQYLSLLNIFF